MPHLNISSQPHGLQSVLGHSKATVLARELNRRGNGLIRAEPVLMEIASSEDVEFLIRQNAPDLVIRALDSHGATRVVHDVLIPRGILSCCHVRLHAADRAGESTTSSAPAPCSDRPPAQSMVLGIVTAALMILEELRARTTGSSEGQLVGSLLYDQAAPARLGVLEDPLFDKPCGHWLGKRRWDR